MKFPFYLVFIPWLLHTGQACSNCLNSTCTDGECIDGCKNGYYGRNCDIPCRNQCINRTCELSPETGSARCSNGCTNGWKGDNCELRCSRRCEACNSTMCVRCKSNHWYGPQCRRFCYNCPGNVCHRNGSCMYTTLSMMLTSIHPVSSTEDISGGEDETVYTHGHPSVSSLSTPANDDVMSSDVTSSDVTSDVVISPSKKFNVTASCFIVAGLGSLILISTVFTMLSLYRKKEIRDRCSRKCRRRKRPLQKVEVIYDEIECPPFREVIGSNGIGNTSGVYLTPLFVPQRAVPVKEQQGTRESAERSCQSYTDSHRRFTPSLSKFRYRDDRGERPRF